VDMLLDNFDDRLKGEELTPYKEGIAHAESLSRKKREKGDSVRQPIRKGGCFYSYQDTKGRKGRKEGPNEPLKYSEGGREKKKI